MPASHLSSFTAPLQLLDATTRKLCTLLALVASALSLSATLALSGLPEPATGAGPLRGLACANADPATVACPCAGIKADMKADAKAGTRQTCSQA